MVFDQVFKDSGVEVDFCVKMRSEAEIGQFVDNGAAEVIAFDSSAMYWLRRSNSTTFAPPSVLTAKTPLLLVAAMSIRVSSKVLAKSLRFVGYTSNE